jgi:hypothetical protein
LIFQEKEAQRLEKEAKAKAREEKKAQKEAEDKIKAEQKAQKEEEKRKKNEERDEKKRLKEEEQQRLKEEEAKKARVSRPFKIGPEWLRSALRLLLVTTGACEVIQVYWNLANFCTVSDEVERLLREAKDGDQPRTGRGSFIAEPHCFIRIIIACSIWDQY